MGAEENSSMDSIPAPESDVWVYSVSLFVLRPACIQGFFELKAFFALGHNLARPEMSSRHEIAPPGGYKRGGGVPSTETC